MSSTGASSACAAHARRALLGVILGALLAATGTVLMLGSPRAQPAPSPAGAAPARTPSAAEQVYARAHPGDCLTWDTPSAGDVTLTDCTAPHRFDPHGLFSVGLIDPGEAAWRDGQRDILCGLQEVGNSGEQFPISGRVAQLDQSDVAPPGSCQNILAATKGLTVYWNTVAPDSWAAGSRRVNCKVGRQVPGGGFAPIAGVARNAGAVAAPPPTTTGR